MAKESLTAHFKGELPNPKINDDNVTSRGFFRPKLNNSEVINSAHELYYEDWGNNKNPSSIFVVMHGGPGAGFTSSLADFFDPNTDRVIFYDQPGAGYSRSDGDYLENNTTEVVVEATKQLIEHVIGGNGQDRHDGDRQENLKVNLVGQSWGSMLAFAFASTHPKMVDNVVTIANMGPDKEHHNASLNGRVDESKSTQRSLNRLLGQTSLTSADRLDDYSVVAGNLYETILNGRNKSRFSKAGRDARKAAAAFGIHQLVLAGPRSKEAEPSAIDRIARVLNYAPLLGAYAISTTVGPLVGISDPTRYALVALHYFKDELFVEGYDRFQGESAEKMRQIGGEFYLINGTEDPSTPIEGAQVMVERIGKAKAELQAVEGAGHRVSDLGLKCALQEAIRNIRRSSKA